MKKNIVIIHYNTPRLTECLVKSINKFVKDAVIYIFDNSDKFPFTAKFNNVKILDNTKGQIIDFNKWLEKYPNRNRSHGRVNNWGSAKHCYSVEKCMDIINDNFILLDSDILLKRDISNLYRDESVYCGEVVTQPKSTIKRILPYICFINVKMCKEKNVHYFNDNYMHGLCKTYNADRYDTGSGFFVSSAKLKHTDIKCGEYITHYGHGSWNDENEIKTLSANRWLMKNKKYWGDKNKKVVYTCITGGYDSLIEPSYITEGFDYVCFTDNPGMKSDIWEIRPLPKETEGLSQVKKQRYVKINPHLLLSDYDISIWVDGNITLKGDLNEFINNTITDRVYVYIPKHPSRNCIYTESRAVLSMRKDKPEIVNKQMDRYKKEGFPNDFGLPQSNIILRLHNNTDCIKLMAEWWKELKDNSHRDQLSFNYALWKNNNVKVTYLDKRLYESKWFSWAKTHKRASSKTPNTNTPKTTVAPSKELPTYKERLEQVKKEVRKRLTEKRKDRILETFNVGIYGL